MAAWHRVTHRSVRFRLTAWYTLLLAIVILAVGIALTLAVQRQLRQSVDDRLMRTVDKISPEVEVGLSRRDTGIVFDLPELNPITSPGQVVQILAYDGTVMTTTGGSDDDALPFTPIDPDDVRQVRFTNAEIDGAAVRIVTYPMIIRGNRDADILVGAIVVAESLEPVERTLAVLTRLLLLALPIGLVLSAFGGWFLAGRALDPVDRITTTAASIATSRYGSRSLATRLDVPNTNDEIARLARTFNHMLDRLEETFRAQRRFVADASHELRTPLTAIRGNIDVMLLQVQRGEGSPEDLADAMEDIRRESARMSRLIADLLSLARTDAPPDQSQRLTPIPLNAFVTDALRTATGLTAGQQVRAEPLPDATIIADRDQMTELLLILLDNAIRHTPTGGEIVVSADLSPTTVRIAVLDTGEGISEEDLPHVFDRFYRSSRSRDRATGGTGLGLAIAQSIAHLHGGEIVATSTPGSGSTFTVTLPRSLITPGSSSEEVQGHA